MTDIFQKTKDIIVKNYYSYIIFTNIRAYALYFLNKISNYSLEKRRFYKALGYKVDLKTPKTFNEKIMWKKIYDRNPLLPITSDKFKVRSYIKNVLGEQTANGILVPLYYVTDRPETIPFNELPAPYIIKPNHYSGKYIIIRDNNFDKAEIIKACNKWLKTPYGLEKLEWAYQPIKRKIIIEKLLLDKEGNIPADFKFSVLHGECVKVRVVFSRSDNMFSATFDREWNLLIQKGKGASLLPKIEKPENYEVMLEIAEKLSTPFDHIRVDLYNIERKIYVGELTHYPKSGLMADALSSPDADLGKYWKIIPEYWKK